MALPPSQSSETTRPAAADWLPPVRLPVVGLTVLWHPDLARVGERVPLGPPRVAWTQQLSRLEPEFGAPRESRRMALADLSLSRRPVVQLTSSQSGSVRVERGPGAAALELDGQPLAAALELDASSLARGVTLVLSGRIALLLHLFDPLGAHGLPDLGLVGASDALDAVRREVLAVAALDVPVLLIGESGSGKELVARALHDAGRRRSRPFVPVNLGAVPAALAASELFGVTRGAFTGAERNRPGLFRRAHGGTLFLDEIATAPLELQALLLRACDTGEIQPLGAEAAERVDVRLVAATDADLQAAVEQERFRAPLLYRLGAYRLRVPPLRERRDDVGRLLLHWLRAEGALEALSASGAEGLLPASLVARLASHDWPGNVRELRNAARRLAVLARSAPWRLYADAPEALRAELVEPREPASPAEPRAPAAPAKSANELTDEELVAALRANRFRIKPTAERLGVARSSLYERLERCALVRRPGDLSAEEIRASLAACGQDVLRAAERLEVSPPGLKRRLSELGLG